MIGSSVPIIPETAADIGADPAGSADAVQSHLDAHAANTTTAHGIDTIVSTLATKADQAAVDLKAPLASPSLTGTPQAPTADPADDSTKVATTAFVQSVIRALVNLAPADLDTLKEIADRLQGDETTAAALATTVAGKLSKAANLSDLTDPAAGRGNLGLGSAATHSASDFDAAGAAASVYATLNPTVASKADAASLTAHTSNTSNPHAVTKTQVGLNNVANLTPDAISFHSRVPTDGNYLVGWDTGSTTSTIPSNWMMFQAVWMPAGWAPNRIAASVTTAATGATFRLGIYTSPTAYPSWPTTLVFDSGDISAATTGVKEAVFSVSLPTGQWVWLAILCSSTTPQFRASTTLANTWAVGTTYDLQLNSNIRITGQTYGALPTSVGVGAGTANAPIIALRKV